MDKKARIYNMKYETVYPLYLAKVEKKDRTQEELDEVLIWLTGLDTVASFKGTYEELFHLSNVPETAADIKGVICGVRVEEIEDPVIKFLRQMDKIVDELAKGKKIEKIIRQ